MCAIPLQQRWFKARGSLSSASYSSQMFDHLIFYDLLQNLFLGVNIIFILDDQRGKYISFHHLVYLLAKSWQQSQ